MRAIRQQANHRTLGKPDQCDPVSVDKWLTPKMLGCLKRVADAAEQIDAAFRTVAHAEHAPRPQTVHQ